MSFIRIYATKSMFSPHNMVCRHISKLHSENHDLGIIIFCKKNIKILTPLSQLYTEIVDYHWVHIRSLNSWSTVNQYCDDLILSYFLRKVNYISSIQFILVSAQLCQQYFRVATSKIYRNELKFWTDSAG